MIALAVAVLNSEIHGLADESLTTAPIFGQISLALRERLARLRLIVPNPGFDAEFLTAECQQAGTEFCPDTTFAPIDSLHLARRTRIVKRGLTSRPPRHRLDALCERFQIINPAPHTALGDMLATAGVLRAIAGCPP